MKARDRQGHVLELTRIAGDWSIDECECVSRTDRGTAVVRGTVLRSVDTPQGDVLAEISIKLLLEAARTLR